MRFAAAIAGLATALGTAAHAQNPDPRRLTLRQETLGWEGVGRLDIASEGFCTGTLIAPDLVLTAAHCVIDRDGSTPRNPRQVLFRAAYVDGTSIAERIAARIVIHPDYDPAHAARLENLRHDVALVQLTTPIPAATAAPFLVARPGAATRLVSVVSYARGRSEAPSWQRSCGVLGRRDGLLAFDCDVTFGSSGAPVFERFGARARIVSIISGGSPSETGMVSLGMELSGLVDDLKALLRRPAAHSPGARFVRPPQSP